MTARGSMAALAWLAVAVLPASAVAAPRSELPSRFVSANIEWLAAHRLGQALIERLELDVEDRRDAAEEFASATILARHADGQEAAARLAAVAEGWFLMSVAPPDTLKGPGLDRAYGFDGARAFRVLCMARGADAEIAGDAALWAEMPPAGFDACPIDRDLVTERWDVLLSDVALFDGEPPSDVTVRYAETDLVAPREALEASGQLERTADDAASVYALIDPLVIEARACDGGVEPGNDAAILCYEWVADLLAIDASEEERAGGDEVPPVVDEPAD